MKTVSQWARRHPWYARLIIGVGHSYLFIVATAYGISLAHKGFVIPRPFLLATFLAFMVLTILYPSKKLIPSKRALHYRATRLMHLALVVTGFCMVLCTVNLEESADLKPMDTIQVVPIVYHLPSKKEVRLERRSLRKALRASVRSMLYKADKKMPVFIKVILSLLILGGMILLFYGLVALSCSIACSGAEGVAIFVLVAGAGLIVWLVAIGLKALWGHTNNYSNKSDSGR